MPQAMRCNSSRIFCNFITPCLLHHSIRSTTKRNNLWTSFPYQFVAKNDVVSCKPNLIFTKNRQAPGHQDEAPKMPPPPIICGVYGAKKHVDLTMGMLIFLQCTIHPQRQSTNHNIQSAHIVPRYPGCPTEFRNVSLKTGHMKTTQVRAPKYPSPHISCKNTRCCKHRETRRLVNHFISPIIDFKQNYSSYTSLSPFQSPMWPSRPWYGSRPLKRGGTPI